jgi:S-DNA-T family DNA segregation ATPase FtsK/SpoIIIE
MRFKGVRAEGTVCSFDFRSLGHGCARDVGTECLNAGQFADTERCRMSNQRKIRNDIVAVGLLAMIVFLVASLGTYDPADPAFDAPSVLTNLYQPDQLVYPANESVANACGSCGAWTADMLLHTLGYGAYYSVLGLIAMVINMFRREATPSPWLKTIGWMFSLIGLTAMTSMLLPSWTISPLIGAGGYLGALGKGLLNANFGVVGSLIIGAAVLLTGLMMWTEYLVFRAGRMAFAPAMVAATALLPFGLLHGFVTWFNGTTNAEEEDIDEHEYDEYEDDDDQSDVPRTIRFRRRSAEAADEVVAESDELEDAEEEGAEEGDDSDEEYEDYVDGDESDGEQFDAEDRPTTTLKIKSATKQVAPALAPVETGTAAEATTESSVPKPHFKVPAAKKPKPPSEREQVMSQLNEAAVAEDMVDYELPSLNLLDTGDEVPFEAQKREALRKADVLERTCKEFGYDVKVVEIETGPVISQYEIELAPGLRLQKITALSDDLAIAMRVPSVRIVAPIPGKNSVGVEVPNETRQIVHLREVMEQSDKQIKKMKIPLFLGADAVGAPMVADLAALPHLLIAGRTGTGKSVALNAIISSILMTRRPDEVRMLMIDPKMVELSGYARLPHLMHPVVTDMRKAEAILAWAVDKMEERYALLARAGVRHVTSYNQLGEEELMDRLQPQTDEERKTIPRNLPFIVIVADEMADLMMTAGKEVEAHIIRLAQKSRAVGIHLILATQKPTVDVITGLIKSNLPARIAFQVASKTDSRVVLDAGGADKLLGCGDMLFLWPGTSTLLRGQGTYLSDPEIDRVTDAVSTGEQHFVHELVNMKIKSDDEDGDDSGPKKLENRDELYAEAVTIVVNEQRGSCSLLQRAMGIGYGRAARLIDFMAEDGYVGPYNGAKAREVMMTPEQWENIRTGGDGSEFEEDEDEEQPTAAEEVSTLPPKLPPPAPKSRLLKNLADTRTTQLAADSVAPVEERVDSVEDEFASDEDTYASDEHAEEDEYEYEDVEDGDSEDEYEEIEYEADGDEYEDVEEDEDEEEYEYDDDDEEYEDVD